MTLRDRLDRLRPPTGAPPQAPLREHAQAESRTLLEQRLGASRWDTPRGSCLVIKRRFPLEVEHGIHGKYPAILAGLARDSALVDFNLEHTLFLDTETTGLAGGTGTLAFLVGIGKVQGLEFVLSQFMLAQPSDEPAMLYALEQELQQATGLVTFNGKTFDLPLLATRYRLARQDFPGAGLLHLDLLHPARRMWSTRLASCALGELEIHILRRPRQGDIPGWMIPAIYTEYLQTGNPGRLPEVLEHNALDIRSLLALADTLTMMCHAPEAAGLAYGTDWFNVGRFYEEMGDWRRAEEVYQQALRYPLDGLRREQVWQQLSQLYRRTGQWEAAAALWHALVERPVPRSLFPFVELAKYYEHRLGDLGSATNLTRQALAWMENLPPDAPDLRRQILIKELQQRLSRLERKQERATWRLVREIGTGAP